MLKIKGTEIQQALTELALEAAGPAALAFDPELVHGGDSADDMEVATTAPHYFNFRKATIYGGSNEIQKNIIAQMILGV
jgi:hypothetical protein